MRRLKAFLLLGLMFTPLYMLSTVLPVKADYGQAKVYIICLSGCNFTGLNFGGQVYDAQKVKNGAIRALSFKERYDLPWAHPKLGKTPPFYGTSYEVVTDWDMYKSIVESESFNRIIVINTHGEMLPIPLGYNPMEWVTKIAEAMLKRRVTWVHTGGYPFYYVWHQGNTGPQEWPSHGEYGFQNLTGHINLSGVTCYPSGDETVPVDMNLAADATLRTGWADLSNAMRVERGRPLKASDFSEFTVLPIWGSKDDYMTGAVIGFAKVSQRFSATEEYGFGAYVHIGTRKTFTSGNNETDSDYWRGYAGTAAAVWFEVEAFEPVGAHKVYLHNYGGEETYITEWASVVTPVIASYSYKPAANTFTVDICFGIYGLMKSNDTVFNPQMGDVQFAVNAPPGCSLIMYSNYSTNGYNYQNPTPTGFYVRGAKLLISTACFLIGLLSMQPGAIIVNEAIGAMATGVGGLVLFSNWLDLFATGAVTWADSGVDHISGEIDFHYNPVKNSTENDGYYYDEFESIIYTEVQVDMENRQQWTIVPLEWYVCLRNNQGEYVAANSGGISLAIYNTPPETFASTVFFEDFEDGMEGWSVEDTYSLADYDYWGISDYDVGDNIGGLDKYKVYCAQVGNNSIHNNVSNPEIPSYYFYGCYDKGMNASLTRSIDLRPYQNATLWYNLGYYIPDYDDYLAIEYYENNVWIVGNNYTGHTPAGHLQTPIPTTAQKIRFRFYSDDDDDVEYGAHLDNIEIKATLPNDSINTGEDAGNDIWDAMAIEISSSSRNYAGYLDFDEDWYQFGISSSDIQNNRAISLSLNPPSNTIFNLELYDPGNNRQASSTSSIQYFLTTSDSNGNWRIKIYPTRGFGQYDFDIQLQYSLTVRTRITEGIEITGVNVWIDSSPVSPSPVTVAVSAGTHIVQVESAFSRGLFYYTFSHWEYNSTNNPRTVIVSDSMTITAYYNVEYEGTCPTLFVWNGTDYTYETLLDIHAESDITLQHRICQPLVKDGVFYKLSLRELDEFTSHIDQVRLYAVDSHGELHICPLVSALHSEQDWVTLKLRFDDDVRVDLIPAQTINLKFTYLGDNIAYFIFEINGHNKKWPG